MTGVHLLYITVDSRQIVLLGGEITLRLAHDEPDKDKTEYSSQDSYQGQDPVHKEHGQDHSHQEQASRDNISQTLVEGLADRIHVIGHARQSIPLRMTIEIAQRQLVNFLCNGRPQPFREILDNRTDDKGLPVVEQGSDCIEHGQQKGNLRHSFQINAGSQTIRNEISNFF